jgi:hypothetical protein
LFVGTEELVEAWRIFTPILHKVHPILFTPILHSICMILLLALSLSQIDQADETKYRLFPHKFGTRGPVEADDFAARYSIQRAKGWREGVGDLSGGPDAADKFEHIFRKYSDGDDGVTGGTGGAAAGGERIITRAGVEKASSVSQWRSAYMSGVVPI